MLVLVDESGDSGLKVEKGASRFFVVALVLFEDHDEALKCDQRIADLRKQLRLPPDYEFHYYHNSNRVREEFLKAITSTGFVYFIFILDKDPKKLWGDGFKHKDSLYKAAARYVFENAKPYLANATVIIDKSGRKVFRSQLATYLKSRMNSPGQTVIRKVKMESSHANNLLQLVDYVAGVANRVAQNKKNGREHRRFLAHNEISVQTWPK